MNLRWIKEEELSWVNREYEALGFVPSTLEDRVAVAVIQGERAGIGRLVSMKEDGFELGEIYTLESFRNRGVAREIVGFLLEHTPKVPIYCLPFEELEHFYASFGFKLCPKLPPSLAKKHAWCLKQYPQTVLAMEVGTAALPK